jgi:hypothetical protein
LFENLRDCNIIASMNDQDIVFDINGSVNSNVNHGLVAI